MNENDATVTTAYDSTDSTATSEYEGSKTVTDCKPTSDCCRCNDKGRCRRCRCVKAGSVWTNCLPLQHGHCMNNNISGINLSWAIRPLITTTLPMFSQIYRQIQRHMPIKLLIQPLVMPSPVLTSLFPTVSLYLIAVGVTTRVASCQRCRCVKAGNTYNNCLPLLCGHFMNNKRTWNTSLMSSTTNINNETTNIPQGINWQVRHHQVPVNSLSQPLILPSPFLTTISMTWDWIQSSVATRWTHLTPRFPSTYNFPSSLPCIWCPTPPSSEEPRTLFTLKLMEDGYSEVVHWQKNTVTVPFARLGRSLCLRWAECSRPTLMEQHLNQLPWTPALHYLSCL